MTNELKNALLKSNIQFINEYDEKFVFLHTETPQYKIVLATYDVDATKVTFVKEMLP